MMDLDPSTTVARRPTGRPSVDPRTVGRVAEAYPRFLRLNGEVLALCTAWQVRQVGSATVPNDHLDEEHDRRTLDRLGVVHRSAMALVEELGGVDERFRCYGSRLDAARRRVQEGQRDWFTRPGVDSYHTIWFELHEALLATMGRSRSDERTPPPPSTASGRPDHPQEQP